DPRRHRAAFAPSSERDRQLAISIQHERPPVEHQLVLTANLIHIRERHIRFARPRFCQLEARGKFPRLERRSVGHEKQLGARARQMRGDHGGPDVFAEDRKSTRLNSSHSQISYAVFCLKKKKNTYIQSNVISIVKKFIVDLPGRPQTFIGTNVKSKVFRLWYVSCKKLLFYVLLLLI